jgi:serine/threonine protein kinase
LKGSAVKLNGQTDLYSLGVSLYELLTGYPQFNANALATLMLAITSQEPNPILDLRPEIPEALALVVHKALARDLSIRYETGAQMAEALALHFFNDFSDA